MFSYFHLKPHFLHPMKGLFVIHLSALLTVCKSNTLVSLQTKMSGVTQKLSGRNRGLSWDFGCKQRGKHIFQLVAHASVNKYSYFIG
jgi:hypothetical protein